MFGEFAVDPKLFANETFARVLMATVGNDTGRLLSDHPRRWSRLVNAEINRSELGDVMRKTLKQNLVKLQSAIISNPYRTRAEGDWRPAVLESHADVPFSAVVSFDADDGMVPIDDVLNETCPVWQLDMDMQVRRLAVDIVGALIPLLKLARKAVIVDPYFVLINRRGRFDVVLHELLSQCPDMPMLTSLTIHSARQTPHNASRQLREQDYRTPPTMRVRWFHWQDNALHDRYLVTDVGSIALGQGFDQKLHEDGSGTDFVHMQRVGHQVHRDLLARYIDAVPQQYILESATLHELERD